MAYTNYIHRTPSSNGNRQKFTISTWVKRTDPVGQGWILTVDSYPGGNMFQFQLDTGSYLGVQQYHGSSAQVSVTTHNLLRDPAAWYHLVLRVDTTQSTAADRVRIYINGTEASYNNTTYPSQNFEFQVNHVTKQSINSREDNSSGKSLYFSHYHLCDGYSYAPTEFGETDATTGEWKIKTDPSVSYGTNGFFIFKNGMNLSGSTVQDQSGQSNNLTLVGSSVETKDNPDNNFATLNSLGHASASFTLIEGNLYSGGADNNWRSIFGTLGAIAGKYYYEVKIIGTANEHIGIASADQIAKCSDSAGKFTDSTYGTEGYAYTNGGQKSNNGTDTNWGNSYTTNDIIGVALDLDNSKIYFSKNGTFQESGDPTSGSTGTGAAYTLVANKFYLPAMASYGGASNMAFNFGNGYFRTTAVSSAGTNASGHGVFEYDVPTGYTALCTKGLNE